MKRKYGFEGHSNPSLKIFFTYQSTCLTTEPQTNYIKLENNVIVLQTTYIYSGVMFYQRYAKLSSY